MEGERWGEKMQDSKGGETEVGEREKGEVDGGGGQSWGK